MSKANAIKLTVAWSLNSALYSLCGSEVPWIINQGLNPQESRPRPRTQNLSSRTSQDGGPRPRPTTLTFGLISAYNTSVESYNMLFQILSCRRKSPKSLLPTNDLPTKKQHTAMTPPHQPSVHPLGLCPSPSPVLKVLFRFNNELTARDAFSFTLGLYDVLNSISASQLGTLVAWLFSRPY